MEKESARSLTGSMIMPLIMTWGTRTMMMIFLGQFWLVRNGLILDVVVQAALQPIQVMCCMNEKYDLMKSAWHCESILLVYRATSQIGSSSSLFSCLIGSFYILNFWFLLSTTKKGISYFQLPTMWDRLITTSKRKESFYGQLSARCLPNIRWTETSTRCF